MTTARPQQGRLVAVPATETFHIHELGLHRHLLVSERLRVRRRQLGLTQKEVVARLRRLGVDTTNKSLSSLEHGAGLDVCKLPELARALDCTLTYLVGLSADPFSWQPDEGTWPLPDRESERGDTACDPELRPETAERTEGPWILGPVPAFRRRAVTPGSHPAPTSGASPGNA
jgi:transcriptional regulator with XRE-family HTH domain